MRETDWGEIRSVKTVLACLVGNYWSMEDPWEPGFFMDFKKHGGKKEPQRFVRIYFPGPTWLDQMIIDLEEALQRLRSTPPLCAGRRRATLDARPPRSQRETQPPAPDPEARRGPRS